MLAPGLAGGRLNEGVVTTVISAAVVTVPGPAEATACYADGANGVL